MAGLSMVHIAHPPTLLLQSILEVFQSSLLLQCQMVESAGQGIRCGGVGYCGCDFLSGSSGMVRLLRLPCERPVELCCHV